MLDYDLYIQRIRDLQKRLITGSSTSGTYSILLAIMELLALLAYEVGQLSKERER